MRVAAAAAVDSGVRGVRVFQMDHQQSKRVFAEVKIAASVEQVWRVITDYDHLADFVPNLVTSERLPPTAPGRIHLRQVGCSQSVFWRLEAEAVLECVEMQKAMGAKELRFKAIEGDFEAGFLQECCLVTFNHHIMVSPRGLLFLGTMEDLWCQSMSRHQGVKTACGCRDSAVTMYVHSYTALSQTSTHACKYSHSAMHQRACRVLPTDMSIADPSHVAHGLTYLAACRSIVGLRSSSQILLLTPAHY